MSSEDKYKMLKQFMFNELGISKEDIRDWVKEAATKVAEERMAQINFDSIATRVVSDSWSDTWHGKDNLRREIVALLADRISLSFKNNL